MTYHNHTRKETRQNNAILRRIEYDGLSTEEKLKKAKAARGNSSKQIERLENQLVRENLVVETKATKKAKKD